VQILALAENVAMQFIDVGGQTQLGSSFCVAAALAHFESLSTTPYSPCLLHPGHLMVWLIQGNMGSVACESFGSLFRNNMVMDDFL